MKQRSIRIGLLLCGFALATCSQNLRAQEMPAVPQTAETDFMIVGLTTFGFVNQSQKTAAGTDKENSLGDADRYEFSPMFLWRHGNQMLAEFEPSFNGSSLGVNWAEIAYFVSPGLIIKGGYLVLPFGSYTKRLAAGWIDKLPSDPMGTGVAGSDFGVEVEGGMALGGTKLSYDVSLTNGFQLNNDGSLATPGIGLNTANNNNNGKTVCGRVGFLPLHNSGFEIGLSGLYGSVATPYGATFTNIDPTSTAGPTVSMYAVDFNYIHTFSALSVNIKGQYSSTIVSNMRYTDTALASLITFNNTTNAFFGQISVRPVHSIHNAIRSLEFALRYVNYVAPENSSLGQNYSEVDGAIDYWFSWRTVLKLGYEHVTQNGTAADNTNGLLNGTTTTTDRMILQFSTEL